MLVRWQSSPSCRSVSTGAHLCVALALVLALLGPAAAQPSPAAPPAASAPGAASTPVSGSGSTPVSGSASAPAPVSDSDSGSASASDSGSASDSDSGSASGSAPVSASFRLRFAIEWQPSPDLPAWQTTALATVLTADLAEAGRASLRPVSAERLPCLARGCTVDELAAAEVDLLLRCRLLVRGLSYQVLWLERVGAGPVLAPGARDVIALAALDRPALGQILATALAAARRQRTEQLRAAQRASAALASPRRAELVGAYLALVLLWGLPLLVAWRVGVPLARALRTAAQRQSLAWLVAAGALVAALDAGLATRAPTLVFAAI